LPLPFGLINPDATRSSYPLDASPQMALAEGVQLPVHLSVAQDGLYVFSGFGVGN
jgi:hypothetical protein